MSRPPLEADPQYAEYKARLDPLKGAVERAKAEAARDVERAKERVEAETLAIIREAVEAGYSQYAVGKLLGKTRSEDQKKLIEQAMGVNWVPSDRGQEFAGVVIEGYKVDHLAAPGERTWVTAPNGDRYTFERTPSGHIVWRAADGHELEWEEQKDALTMAVEDYAQYNAD